MKQTAHRKVAFYQQRFVLESRVIQKQWVEDSVRLRECQVKSIVS